MAGGLSGHPEAVDAGERDRGLHMLDARGDAHAGGTLVAVEVPGLTHDIELGGLGPDQRRQLGRRSRDRLDGLRPNRLVSGNMVCE